MCNEIFKHTELVFFKNYQIVCFNSVYMINV